jgi:hypothetical protein
MRTLIMLSICLFFAIAAPAQTTTPTPDTTTPTLEQCRANYPLWAGDKTDPKMSDVLKSLSTDELLERGRTMGRCGQIAGMPTGSKVNSQNITQLFTATLESSRYSLLAEIYLGNVMFRYRQYIERHGEMEQFLREDAAGQR